jgi:hypothetical protein
MLVSAHDGGVDHHVLVVVIARQFQLRRSEQQERESCGVLAPRRSSIDLAANEGEEPLIRLFQAISNGSA